MIQELIEHRDALNDRIENELARLFPPNSEVYLRLQSRQKNASHAVVVGYRPERAAVCVRLFNTKKNSRFAVRDIPYKDILPPMVD